MKRVTPAISKGIAENKDTMIDALYPIMGGMISKYVSQAIKEMMESINSKIEDGLSFNKYKRKVKSKISGVSETELLIEESNEAIISSLFIIHKESGLLIAEANLEDKEIDDPHMVASMASAIKDFINDWVQSNNANSEVQILSYGNATLYIESAGSVYTIAFLDAEPDHEQRLHINAFFASVVKEYAEFFQKFDGDDSANEIEILSSKMNHYLNAQGTLNKVSKKLSTHNPIKYIAIVVCIVCLIALGYFLKEKYLEYTLESKIKESTGYRVELSNNDNNIILKGKVKSFSDADKIEKIIKDSTEKPVINQLTMPLKNIDNMIKKQEQKTLLSINKQVSSSISQLNNKMLFMETNFSKFQKDFLLASKKQEQKIVKLKKQTHNIRKVTEIKKEIISKLNQVFLNNIYYDKKEGALDFRKLNLFPVGEILYDEKAIVELKIAFEKYMTILIPYKEYIKSITIEGYTDSSGTYENNLKLSEKRATSIMKYLLKEDIVKMYQLKPLIHAKGFGSKEIIKINGIENKEASRRIKIKFKIKDTKILENIKKIIND
jgi:flagellar motor protein MotB